MDAVRNTIAENFGGKAHDLAKPEHRFSLDETPDQTGKVGVITGGSEGIGYGAGFTLLKHNLSKLFILSVAKEKIDGALADIKEKLGQEKADRVVWIPCELSDWKAVSEAAQKIEDQTKRIDVLILNSARGVMTYQVTEDTNLDRHMAVNHFGHVILTSHLLPILKSTASATSTVRISLQSSNAHELAPKDTKFASIDEMNQDFGPNGQYGRSKLANLLYARYLARHLTQGKYPQILANATHPGFVETKMSVEDVHEAFPVLGYGMSAVMKPLKKDQWDGCVSTVFAATKIETSGDYICPPAIPEPGSALARDDKLGEQLMKFTQEVLAEKLGGKVPEFI